MSQSDVRQVDVTLVGGGMSGAVLALSLAALLRSDGSPLEILLLEASVPEQHTHSGFDARAIALSAGTCDALLRRGLWPLFAPIAPPLPRFMSRIGATSVRLACRLPNTACPRWAR